MVLNANKITCKTYVNQTFVKESGGLCGDHICLPKDYNKFEAPRDVNGRTEILLTMDILQFLKVDDIEFSISLLMYFGAEWDDKRILAPRVENEETMIPTNVDFVKNLWVPDIYFYDAKSVQVTSIYKPFKGNLFVILFLISSQLNEKIFQVCGSLRRVKFITPWRSKSHFGVRCDSNGFPLTTRSANSELEAFPLMIPK